MTDLTTRAWNGTPISRRATDGYANATAMCKANGKEWKHFFETDRCHKYLAALSGSVGIPTDQLFVSITTGANEGRGTWVHPRLAVELARWISAEFAVWMDGWFLEELNKTPAPAPAAALPAERMLEVVERTVDIFERLGGLDERDQLLFKDIVRSNLLRASSGSMPALSSADDEELTLSDAWLEVMGAPLQRSKAPAVGRLVAEMYRQEFNKEPATRTQFVDGAPRKVKSYLRGWLLKAIEAIKFQLNEHNP